MLNWPIHHEKAIAMKKPAVVKVDLDGMRKAKKTAEGAIKKAADKPKRKN